MEVNHREGAEGNWSLVGKQPRAKRLLSAIGQPLDCLVKDSGALADHTVESENEGAGL